MSRFNVKRWGAATAVRGVKTAAQSAIGAIGATAVVNEVDWGIVVGTVGIATVLSILTSLTGLPEVDDGASPLARNGD